MSGIAGIIHFDGKPVERELIEKMTDAMAHRGPNGINHWVQGNVSLGQCMLRTTPESLGEHQPLTNEDESLVLVMDGRVDNWEELRRDLLQRGAVLRDCSDAELALRAYQLWGRDCLERIDGDFALVIWDARRREAFCARDRMGNKPFHYHWDGRNLVFASELHAILALPWVRQELNEGALAEFLAAEWYSRDETLWIGVMRLVKAHRMTASVTGLRLERFWEPDTWSTPTYQTDEEYAERYRELLFDSVRRLSRSHQSVAIEVSGGLDSSSIFCIAHHLLRAGQLEASDTDGYTLPFIDDERANELRYARSAANYLGTPIEEIPPSTVDFRWFEEHASVYQNFPGFPNGTMSQDLLSHVASKGSTVILSGGGGDEWLTGTRTYYAEELAQWRWHNLTQCLKADVEAFGVRQTALWFARHGFFPLLPDRVQKAARGAAQHLRGTNRRRAQWLSARMQNTIARRRRSDGTQPRPKVRHCGQRELHALFHDPFLSIAEETGERLYAASGLEARYPLHTPTLVQFAFSTPARLRLRGDRSKHLHRQALKDLMPESILERRDKAEFSVTFRTHLEQVKERFLSSLPTTRTDWVSREGLAKLVKAYEDNGGTGTPLWILWSIIGCDLLVTQTVAPSPPVTPVDSRVP